MELESSLSHSHELVTSPYPEPYKSSSYLILLLEDTFKYYPLIYA